MTNHFLPNVNTGPVELFPRSWKEKVWKSDIGVVAVVAGLAWWAANAGFASVFALYVGPYMFVNVWLVLYTWLQHTDTDVPHLEASEWSYIKGAFLTIDRPYGAVFAFCTTASAARTSRTTWSAPSRTTTPSRRRRR